ncbi:MAG: UDP-N-acetylglucosamine 2-epimerase (hydrolyzing) [Candidatus Omnitrophica bacterium]|nr:UDP-N-acetylglucosamine 2-epimerase (hydrolyzing) [Candidatus Omnitrophota bacterium]
MRRKICVVTGSRAEYGTLYQTIQKIAASNELELQLVVTGMHLSGAFGYTVKEIEKDGYLIADRVEMLMASDSKTAIGKSVGLGVIGFVDCYKRLEPDIVLLTGDRFEMFAAATAAMMMNLPIAHISGGEISEGALDEQIRHAITKMSHLHFVAIEENAAVVRQMGEEPWRIKIVGGTWIDNLKKFVPFSRESIQTQLGVELFSPAILVTYHPVTLELDKLDHYIEVLFAALARVKGEIIFTYPNADAGGEKIIRVLESFRIGRPQVKVFKSLGWQMYYSLLKHVDIMVGNSSSGIHEGMAFQLPVVNIGNRQRGRFTTGNVISVADDQEAIYNAIQQGLRKDFKANIKMMRDPYDKGDTSGNIVQALKTVDLGSRILSKRFLLSSD